MAYKKIASMEPKELESAIAWGIFKGGASLAILLFALWILMPFILPLAILLGAFVTNEYLEPFAVHISTFPISYWKKILGTFILFSLAIFLIYLIAIVFKGSIFFEHIKNWAISKKEQSGISMTSWGGIGLYVGFVSLFFCISFSVASIDMPRKFIIDDLIFLLGLFVISVASFYFSFKKSPKI